MRCAIDGSTSCSPPTSSMRVSTCQPSTPSVPAADRERDDLPATARPRSAPRLRQARPHRTGFCRAPAQGIPVRRPVPGADRSDPAGTRPSGRAGFPVPAVGLADHPGQADPGVGARQHQEPTDHPMGVPGGRTPELPETSIWPASCTNRASNWPTSVRSNRSWTRLRRDAGLPTRAGQSREEALLKRIRSLGHVDDKDRASAYQALLADDAAAYHDLNPADQAFARMLLFSLWPGGGFASYESGLCALRTEPAVRDELRSVIDVTFDQARHVTLGRRPSSED